jgi:type IV secretion system pilin
MKTKLLIITLTLICCTTLFFSSGGNSVVVINGTNIAQAADKSVTSVSIPNPLKVTSISSLIDRIVDYVIGIASIILPLVIIWGAYQMIWSGGDLEKIISGRKTITYAIIGFALILISKGIAMIVAEIMGG